MLKTITMQSPPGPLTLVANAASLLALTWGSDAKNALPGKSALIEPGTNPILAQAEDELNAYFAKRLRKFTVPLSFAGTLFQQQVWQALQTIPYGATRSYGEIAKQVGSPGAVRAVGAANGKNPISIIAPCHRVIGADGSLTGFGGGLPRKKLLLELEAQGRQNL